MSNERDTPSLPATTGAWVRAVLSGVDRSTWQVAGFAGVLFVAFSAYTVALYHSYALTAADFGSYVHMFATTLDGEGFLLQGKYRASHPSGVYWGAHFSLTLLAFLPVYALVPRPETLLVAKSFVLAASVVALWLVAREHVDSDRLAKMLVVSYGLNPFLWSAWAFDFQEQVLLPPLVFLAYYWYRRERWVGFLVALGLALLTNEFAILVLVGFLVGLGVAAFRRGRLATRGPMLAAGLGLAAVVRLLASAVVDRYSVATGIPTASLAEPYRAVVTGTRAPIVELVGLVLSDPSLLAAAATTDAFQKFAFFLLLLVPVVFLAVTDEAAVGALVPFLGFAWFVAGRPVYYLFGAHYPLYLLPVVYVGTVRVVGRLDATAEGRDLLVHLFAVVVVLGVLGGATVAVERDAFPHRSGNAETVEAAIEAIPHDASLVTQNDVYPHVATRPRAGFVVNGPAVERYETRYGRLEPTYVLVDTDTSGGQVDWSAPVRSVFGPRLGTQYGLVMYQDGVWLFRRGYDGPTTAITSDRPVDVEYTYDPSVREVEPSDPFRLRLAGTTPEPDCTRPVAVGATRTSGTDCEIRLADTRHAD